MNTDNRPLPPPQAVFFDLDGTLADTAPDLVEPIQAMRAERGLPPVDFTLMRSFASMGARGLVGQGFGVTVTDPAFAVLRDEFLARYEQAILVRTRLFEEMDEVLSVLERERIAWGVVSNKIERFVRPILGGLGLLERAACVVGGDTTGRIKPDPAPLLHGAKAAGVDPSRCVYVGDDLRDVQAGRSAGMRTIAAAYGYCGAAEPQHWKADHLINSPIQLLSVLGIARFTSAG